MKALMFTTMPNILGWCWSLALAGDLLLLPLSLVSRARRFAGSLLFASSYVFGVSLWYLSAIMCLAFWGHVALIVGLLVFGVFRGSNHNLWNQMTSDNYTLGYRLLVFWRFLSFSALMSPIVGVVPMAIIAIIWKAVDEANWWRPLGFLLFLLLLMFGCRKLGAYLSAASSRMLAEESFQGE